MSAFGGKADMTLCGCLLSWSLLGVKLTWPVAVQMSANDPKRTSCTPILHFVPSRDRYVETTQRHTKKLRGMAQGPTFACSTVIYCDQRPLMPCVVSVAGWCMAIVENMLVQALKPNQLFDAPNAHLAASEVFGDE